tara:strand:- start:57230 stop:57988 length:759 start_codon:yes stop_codon:yes gene_type:complete
MCKTSQKPYIGLTTMKLNERWNKHTTDARKYIKWKANPEGKKKPNGCTKLYTAMAKYGIEDFEIKELIVVDNMVLDDTEIEYIKKYDSIINGYNLREGGGHGFHSKETKNIIAVNTKTGMHKNISVIKKYDSVKNLPPYIIRVNIKNSEGVAINNHPLCKRKSFTVRKYVTIENAIEACLIHLKNLEDRGKVQLQPKKGGLEIGLRVLKNGYAVQKIHNKKLYYKSFTQGNGQDLQNARIYLHELLKSWEVE